MPLFEDPITGDLALAGGSLKTIIGSEFVGQKILSRLKTKKGEWFLDTLFGLDYVGVVWKKKVSTQVRDAHIQRQALLSAGRGGKIRTYSSSVDGPTRTLTVNIDVQLGSESTSVSITTGT